MSEQTSPSDGPEPPLPSGPLPDGASTPLPDEGWQLLHPLSPVLRGGVFFLAVVGYVVSQAWDRIVRILGLEPPGAGGDPGFDETDALVGHPLVVLGALAGVLLVIVAVAYVSWRVSRFRVAGGQIELRSGWLFRQHRQVPLERVQAVEVRRPLLALLFGLSQVVVRSAGGAGSQLTLAYLAAPRAVEVRDELQRLAGRSDEVRAAAQPAPGIPDPAPAPMQAGRLVVAVPNSRLLVATMVHSGTVLALFLVAGLVSAVTAGVAGSIGWTVPMVLAIVASRGRELLRNGRFRLSDLGESLRVDAGLTDQRTTTVPLHRVQCVGVSQNLWWRLFSWWRVEVNVAGVHSVGEDTGEHESVVLPVGTVGEVVAVVRLLAPAVDPDQLWRAMTGEGGDGGWTLVPRRARWVDPLVSRHAGYAVEGSVVLFRRGLLTRVVSLVPHARIQSMRLRQGPLERLAGLADVELVSTPGPVHPVLPHLELAVAERFVHDETLRARAARRPAAPSCETPSPSALVVPTTSPSSERQDTP